MDEMQEYMVNQNRILAIKNTLLAAGLEYDDIHKWYVPNGIRLRKDQKEYLEAAKPIFESLVKRNNVLKKRLGI